MDTLSKERRSEQMSLVRSPGTRSELRVRELAWSLGCRYRKHQRYIVGGPDLAFIDKKSAIFLHGCLWHRHHCQFGVRSPKTRRKFWTAKFQRNVQRELVAHAALEAAGWRSLIVLECELKEPSRVKRKARKFLDA